MSVLFGLVLLVTPTVLSANGPPSPSIDSLDKLLQKSRMVTLQQAQRMMNQGSTATGAQMNYVTEGEQQHFMTVSNGGSTLGIQPTVALQVGRPENGTTIMALVDTGAQATLVTHDAAAALTAQVRESTGISDDKLVERCSTFVDGFGGHTQINYRINFRGVVGICNQSSAARST